MPQLLVQHRLLLCCLRLHMLLRCMLLQALVQAAGHGMPAGKPGRRL